MKPCLCSLIFEDDGDHVDVFDFGTTAFDAERGVAQLRGGQVQPVGEAAGFGAAGKPISTLSTYKLRDLQAKIEDVLADSERIDDYTVAHLSEAKVRIGQALDAQYIRNLDDIRIRLTLPRFMFGEQGED